MSLDAIEDSDSPALSSWILCEVSFRWWSFYPSSQSLRTLQAFWIGETACGLKHCGSYWILSYWELNENWVQKMCPQHKKQAVQHPFFSPVGVGNAGMECAKSTSQYLGLAWNGLGDDACKYLVWISAYRSFDSAGLWGFKTFARQRF